MSFTNKNFTRVIAVVCLFALVVTVFASCKNKKDNTSTATTADSFADLDSTTAESTTGLFDDFATTTTKANTAATTTKKSSSSTSSGTTSRTDTDVFTTTQASSSSSIDYKKLLSAFGYAYDADENCFYSTLDPWQRKMGFAAQYDQAGAATLMHYITFLVDFTWGGEDWRIQFWKGNYGAVLNGAEIGIYNKGTDQNTELYQCADDDHLLNMSMTLYKALPIGSGTYLFTRPAQDHWWLTGFQVTSTLAKPGGMVLVATITFRDNAMANAFETQLKQVSGKYSPYKRFQPVMSAENLTDETYYRNGTAVTLRWRAVGDLNYDY